MSTTFGFCIRTSLPPWTLAFATLSVAACFGRIGDSHDPPPKGPEAIPSVTHSRFARLSHRQWENTVADLLHLAHPTGLSSAFYPDPLGGKTFDNDESALEVTPQLWANYETAAETIARQVMDDASILSGILPPNLPSDAAARRDSFVRGFGERAFRRPLTDDEAARYDAEFDEAASIDGSHPPFVAGVGLVVEAMLQSPYFLYRAELSSTPTSDGRIPLSGFEIATKLSYALWNTMPDEALFGAAADGQLDAAAGVAMNAEQMLDDPRARAMLISFHHQLYQVDQYVSMPTKDAAAYPDFDPTLLPAMVKDMQTEADLFVQDTVVAHGGGLKDLLLSPTAFVTTRLAKIYGLDPSAYSDSSFARVSLDPATRPGILTRSGFLAWKGRAVEPDTILRGVFVNRRILCQKLGDPPPAAAGAMLGNQATDRARVEALTGKGTCGETCHGLYIDPIGYAFESFDAVGGYRTMDEGYPVDASSTFPFDGKQQKYENVGDLAKLIAASSQAHSCYASYWLQFLHGRDLQPADQPEVDQIATLSRGGGSARDIVRQVVTSDSFRMRPANPEEAP